MIYKTVIKFIECTISWIKFIKKRPWFVLEISTSFIFLGLVTLFYFVIGGLLHATLQMMITFLVKWSEITVCPPLSQTTPAGSALLHTDAAALFMFVMTSMAVRNIEVPLQIESPFFVLLVGYRSGHYKQWLLPK